MNCSKLTHWARNVEACVMVCWQDIRWRPWWIVLILHVVIKICLELPICEIGKDGVMDTCSSSAQALPPLPAYEDGIWNRSLMMEEGECIEQEFLKMGAVVKAYDLTDSVYRPTASSSYVSGFPPQKAGLDAHFVGTRNDCAWLQVSSDAEKWLGITLPKN